MPPVMSAADFEVLYQRLQRTVAWGPADRRGALNHITPAQVLAAASEVRLGRTAPLGAAIETEVTLDNPDPCVHQMTSPAGNKADRTGLSFATDRLAMNIHGNADSHIDALCHVIYRALLYNNVPADTITSVRRVGAVNRGGPQRDRRPRCPARYSPAVRPALARARRTRNC